MSFRNSKRISGYSSDDPYGSTDNPSLYDDTMDEDHYTDEVHDLVVEEEERKKRRRKRAEEERARKEQEQQEEFEEEEFEEEELEEEDDLDSILSIPDANIDFDLVYALHTFAATVEGQASVVKGDTLTLLDDTNSYWWLVKVLKTAEIGYIPAENIETPYERLARLNSHRNIELTRRDIQDAFPIPPFSKPINTKKVTLSKGVQFQAQVIFGLSDDEEFEEEFEEWQEDILSSGTDSSDSSDNYEYMEERQMYGIEDYQDGSLALDRYAHEEPGRRMSDEGSLIDSRLIESTERESGVMDHALLDGLDTLGLGRDMEEHDMSDTEHRMSLEGAAVEDRRDRHGQRRPTSRSKDKKRRDRKSVDSLLETASISSQSTVNSERERTGSVDSQHEQGLQQTLLKIYGDSMEASLDPVLLATTPTTTSGDLVIRAIEAFNTQLEHPLITDQYEFHLTVKGIDGDVSTLVPSDKPLAIYHSLMAHRNTPMPSLKKARRISQLMSTSGSAHMGGPREGPAVEQVRFLLEARPRKAEDRGLLQIKACLLASEVYGSTSSLRPDQDRLDKLVSVGPWMLVSEVISLLLEKFHVLNGIVEGEAMEETLETLHLQGEIPVAYGLAMSHYGREHLLSNHQTIQSVYGDSLPALTRRLSNPDRSSMSSLSSTIHAPRHDELFFVLRAMIDKEQETAGEGERTNSTSPRPCVQIQGGIDRLASPVSPSYPTPTNTTTTAAAATTIAYNERRTDEVIRPPSRRVSARSNVDATRGDGGDTTHEKRHSHVSGETGKQRRHVDSMLFCDDFGMEDMMVMIRGACRYEDESQKRSSQGTSPLRSEILEVYKDHQLRLEQLEEMLDQLMADAVKVYAC
ncbi:hypothetical protein BDF14DRAFT_1858855 [Spinellus fusiger]|nr:hypothetical protein BDF14DRAFT_1858855 [Spinellus fusiger]